MIQEYQIRVLPVVASHEQNIRQYVADEEGIDARTINAVRVLKRSIDARQRTIFVNLTVRVYINEMPQDDEYVKTEYGDVTLYFNVSFISWSLIDAQDFAMAEISHILVSQKA